MYSFFFVGILYLKPNKNFYWPINQNLNSAKTMKSILLFLTLFLSASTYGQLHINEIMASNTSTLVDNNGIYNDWIEIYNQSGTPVDLANYYMSDLGSNLTKFRFTSTTNQVVVPANGFLIIWASDNVLGGFNHTNFSLSSTNGETAYLVAPDGTTILSSLTFPSQRDNVSIGRVPDGSATIKYFSPSSPNATNQISNAYDGFLNPPNFSHNGGFFNSNFNLTLSHSEMGTTIYYTTDGSDPTPTNTSGSTYFYKNSYPENPGNPVGPFLSRNYTSSVYASPLPIADRSSTANQISMISSTWNFSPTYFPAYLLKKGTVVRAIATKPGYLPSNISTNTYIFSATATNPYTFPVVSVAMQENHLFEYNQGIYTAGVTFVNYRIANPTLPTDICTPGNFTNNGSLWERPGNLELIENQYNVLNQPLRIRIHGSCSASVPYKSLRFYGVNKFNNYPFFPNQPSLLHDRIILRNSGNDYNQTMFKDAFVHTWLGHLRFSSQKTRPSILFLNGEYWGIHNIRERIDNNYLNALYGVDQNNLDIRNIVWNGPAEIEEGDGVHYDNMYSFITNNDMSLSSNYNQVLQLLDPESLIDYQLAEIFIGNIDWPQNNVRLWRTRNVFNPSAPFGSDGRWRWILFDTDRSLGEVVNAYNQDLAFHTNKPENLLFKKLLENPTFKNNFINRYADLLNTSLKSSHSLPIYNTLKSQYAPEVAAHIARWKNLPNLAAWETQCGIITNYLNNRPSSMFLQIKTFFALTGEFNLTLSSADTTKGYVRINTTEIKNTTKGVPTNYQTWTGAYFDNVPLKITAVPKTGYKFSYWLYNGSQIFDSTITVTSSTDRSYQAHFEILILSNNPIPDVAAELIKCGFSMTEWSPNNIAGNSPLHSKFVYLDAENPTINANIAGYTSGVYNLTSATRINGLDTLGFSFINTGSGNTGYPGSRLGGFLMAINTQNVDTVIISWKGRTITPNPRKYKIRLYYREGDVQPFQEFSPLVEYSGNTIANHSQTFSNIILPNSLINKPYVQLFWKYYATGSASSGARDQLAIDDIFIKAIKTFSGNITSNLAFDEKPNIIKSLGKVNPGNTIVHCSTNQVELLPGFEAKIGSVFKAEIAGCYMPIFSKNDEK